MHRMKSFQDPEISKRLAEHIHRISHKKVRLMEVCGTHTVSIFRSGIRSLLPKTVSLISGPGCPVCVTDQADIDAFILLAELKNVVVATFGDLMRVPGTHGSLHQAQAGGNIKVVYSPLDALAIARKTPSKQVVFLGVGFETTAPTIAAALMTARKEGIDNFLVYSAHKLVPPALAALMSLPGIQLDGFILPGHVSVIIGTDAYRPFVEQYQIPAVIAGFEAADMLQAIAMLVEQIQSGKTRLENAYARVVSEAGNPRALSVLSEVFEIADAPWRGLGVLPGSGLTLREAYAKFDAEKAFKLSVPQATPPAGCACGDILTGRSLPPACPMFGKKCTPEHPVGPCMVSTEGTCAAYYRYE